MIAYLQGQVINKGASYLVVLVNNIGYKVFVTKDLYNEIEIDQSVALHTYHNVKENEVSLFGFKQANELELFELLLSVSGIGPKSGLNVFLVASVDDIKQAIMINDASLLTKVSGIGKKTAERIVLELKNKVSGLININSDDSGLNIASEEIDALIQLGYSLQQAREALKNIDSNITDSAERIKYALKHL
jgi:Holliday junction DNA helicase RuvA